MVDIRPFEPTFQNAVVELIVDIQRNEFGIDIDAARQPDLRNIPAFYQVGCGNFWTAIYGGRVVGTIALLDIGHGQAALRKMFVAREYRGASGRIASRLLATLIDWAAAHHVKDVFLGTTPAFLAAHRFYEKNGFSEIDRSALPSTFPVMQVDKKFYVRQLP